MRTLMPGDCGISVRDSSQLVKATAYGRRKSPRFSFHSRLHTNTIHQSGPHDQRPWWRLVWHFEVSLITVRVCQKTPTRCHHPLGSGRSLRMITSFLDASPFRSLGPWAPQYPGQRVSGQTCQGSCVATLPHLMPLTSSNTEEPPQSLAHYHLQYYFLHPHGLLTVSPLCYDPLSTSLGGIWSNDPMLLRPRLWGILREIISGRRALIGITPRPNRTY
ncbi:hypothetical protein J3A83DRAFT_1617243 [Scleroderma citrinum]